MIGDSVSMVGSGGGISVASSRAVVVRDIPRAVGGIAAGFRLSALG